MTISIYKTNINSKIKNKKKTILDALLIHEKWNFDLEDCDKILRVENKRNICALLIEEFHKAGFICNELL
jgi:hypothetical protein